LVALDRHGWTTSTTAWIARWSEMISRFLVQLPIDLVILNRWTRNHGGHSARAARTLAAWAIPVLLRLVFIGLFARANPVISHWLQRASNSVSDVLTNLFTYVKFDRILLWLVFGLLAWALLRGCTRWRISRAGVTEQAIAQPTIVPQRMDLPALLVRCLILFNLVFAVQMSLDVVTL